MNDDSLIANVEIEKRKVALLKELILLTHPSVSHFGMDEKTVTQWKEFLRQFPDEQISKQNNPIDF